MRLTSQFVTSKDDSKKGGIRYLPFAFTEQGVAMLSSVLRSETALQVNIGIMRTFVAIRQYALGYAELNKKLEDFMLDTNLQFSEIYQALTEFAAQKQIAEKSRKPIGFATSNC